ncbi:polyprenyl synthetase family protein [Micromonospora sp. CPCC 205371]|nr:polyprenyl synthetase family protein [Micromonospora sp. CPCC 205371]
MSTAGLIAEGRTAAEVLAWSRSVVDPALHAATERLPASTQRIAGYHLGWWDDAGRPTTPAGKAMRPALALVCAAGTGNTASAGIPAAVAVELAHNSSLVHDDVIDKDETRRHRPTAWRVFGASAAILAGDALLILAFDALAAGPSDRAARGVAMLHAAFQDLIEGQHADLALEERVDVGLPDWFRMAEAKTGALLGCACGLGALLGGGSPGQIEHLRRFGARLGLAFQAVDDLLGIWGDPAITGKPRHSDLASRKKSVPVVAALTSGTPAARELAALYRHPEPPDGPKLARAAELVEQAGGRAAGQRLAADLLTEAPGELRDARLAPAAGAGLAALARDGIHRDR